MAQGKFYWLANTLQDSLVSVMCNNCRWLEFNSDWSHHNMVNFFICGLQVWPGFHLCKCWDGGHWDNSLCSVIILIFRNDQNTGYLYNIMFIFDRCHHRWAAETPGKCERDLKYLTYTFAESKFPATERLTDSFTNPPPLHSMQSHVTTATAHYDETWQ